MVHFPRMRDIRRRKQTVAVIHLSFFLAVTFLALNGVHRVPQAAADGHGHIILDRIR